MAKALSLETVQCNMMHRIQNISIFIIFFKDAKCIVEYQETFISN